MPERGYLYNCIIYKCILIVCYVLLRVFESLSSYLKYATGLSKQAILTIRLRYIMPYLSSNNARQQVANAVLAVTSLRLHPLLPIIQTSPLIACYSLVLPPLIQCEDRTDNPIHQIRYCFITIYYYQ